MKIFVFIIFFLFNWNLLSSQQLLWKKTISNEPVFWRYISSKIIEDNNQNYICVIKDFKYSHISIASYKSDSELNFFRTYYLPYSVANLSLSSGDSNLYYLNNSIYRDTSIFNCDNPVRYIQAMNIDTLGNIVSEFHNQGIYDSNINNEYNIQSLLDKYPSYVTLTALNKKKEIFAVIQRDILENNIVANNLILKKYSPDCKLLTIKGFDTCDYGAIPGYSLKHFSQINDSEFIAIVYHFNNKTIPKLSEYVAYLIDNNAKVKGRNILNFEYPADIYKCENGSFLFEFAYTNDQNNRGLIKFNKNLDKQIQQKDIRTDNYLRINKIIMLSDGSYVEAGKKWVYFSGSMTPDKDTNEIYIRKLDKDLNILWEFTSERGINNCEIDDIIETKDGNLIFSGKTNPGWTQFDQLYVLKIKDNTFNILLPSITGNNSVCQGDTVQYQTISDAHSSLIWKADGGRILNNASDTIIKILWETSGEGRITLLKKSIYTNRIDSVCQKVLINNKPDKPVITQAEDNLISSSAYGNQWFKNGEIIIGAKEQKLLAKEKGMYTVNVTLENCLSEMSNGYYFETTFIDYAIINNQFISPNPARDYIEIDVGSRCVVTECVSVFNTLGECVMKVEQTSPSVQRIDVSGLTPGVYFLRVGNIVKKFIKM